MASTLKVDQIETPSGVGNISFAQPISGDGSQLTGVGLAVGTGVGLAVGAGVGVLHKSPHEVLGFGIKSV